MGKLIRFSFRGIMFPQINPHFEDWEIFTEYFKKTSFLNFTHAWHSNILPLELIVALSIDSKVRYPYHLFLSLSFFLSFFFPSSLLPSSLPACLPFCLHSPFFFFLLSYIILLTSIGFSEEYCILKLCWYLSIQISQDLEFLSKSMIRYLN